MCHVMYILMCYTFVGPAAEPRDQSEPVWAIETKVEIWAIEKKVEIWAIEMRVDMWAIETRVEMWV